MRGRLVRRVALGIIMLGVCVVLADVAGFTWELRAKVRLREAERIADQLPKIPNAVLLDSREEENRSPTPKCSAAALSTLYGSSTSSLEDVLDNFTKDMGEGKWMRYITTNDYRSFKTTDGTIVAIAGDYEVERFNNAVIMESQTKYRTLFYIRVVRMVYPNECT